MYFKIYYGNIVLVSHENWNIVLGYIISHFHPFWYERFATTDFLRDDDFYGAPPLSTQIFFGNCLQRPRLAENQNYCLNSAKNDF